MRYLLAVLLIFLSPIVLAQSLSKDLKLLKEHNAIRDTNIEIKSSNSRTGFYIRHLYHQVLSDCKYETKCSQFTKTSFQKFGIIKGLFISTDRIIRCDRITNATASPYRLNRKGKMIDHLDEYQKQ